MPCRFFRTPALARMLVFALAGLCGVSPAQERRVYTAEDYARAERMLNYNVEPLVYHSVDKPVWLDDGRFWYRDRGPDGFTFLLVDPAKGTKQTAFDHRALAAALAGKARDGKQPGAAGRLNLSPASNDRVGERSR